jgi:prepilin-type N-terminal cleavage/methylation domain-containing protein
MRRAGARRGRRGFTLFEVVLAIGVLGVGILGSMQMLTALNHQKRNTNVASSSTVLAEEKLERIKAAGFDAARSETEDYGVVPDYPGYRRTTEVGADPGGTLKAVTVTVRERATGESYQLVTFIRR